MGEAACWWLDWYHYQDLRAPEATVQPARLGLKELKNCAKVGYKGGKPDADPNNDEVCITTPLETGGTITGEVAGGWGLAFGFVVPWTA